MRALAAILILFALAVGCAGNRPPDEITPDGLVRVPSRSSGGVYRAPHAIFTQYKRVILEPPSISFAKYWSQSHPDVSAAELVRLRAESVRLFRDEFTREFVERGPYEFADEPAPDVLLVVPAIEDLDIPAPEVAAEPGIRTYTTGPVSMKVSGDLRDAVTGKVVARIITFQPKERYDFNDLRIANRTTNAHEQRVVFGKWARLVHEALNVAKTARPRTPAIVAPQ